MICFLVLSWIILFWFTYIDLIFSLFSFIQHKNEFSCFSCYYFVATNVIPLFMFFNSCLCFYVVHVIFLLFVFCSSYSFVVTHSPPTIHIFKILFHIFLFMFFSCYSHSFTIFEVFALLLDVFLLLLTFSCYLLSFLFMFCWYIAFSYL